MTPVPPRVLLLRPESQTGRLASLLAEKGIESRSMAMLEIRPVPDYPAPDSGLYDGMIYTSRNAVLHGPVPGNPAMTCLAIGPGTAEALHATNPALEVEVPARTDSEGLLALDVLQNISGQRWLIITGREGRDLVQVTLKARGADADVLEVYERQPADPDMAELAAAIEWCSHIVAFSGAGLQRLIELCSGTLYNLLQTRQLVVPSERVVKMAVQQGFKSSPRLISRMSDAEICSAILGTCHDDNDTARPQQI